MYQNVPAVAFTATGSRRDNATTDAQDFAKRRAFGNLESYVAVQGRESARRAEQSVGKFYIYIRDQIMSLFAPYRVRFDVR